MQKKESLPPASALFYLESNFCNTAGKLRAEFETHMVAPNNGSDGLTQLTYAFCEDSYQFLTASADHIFSRAILEDLIEKLALWSKNALGVSCVSTPQLRVYINGCGREMLQDSISADWHYMLSLTVGTRHKSNRIKLIKENGTNRRNGGPVHVHRIAELQLEFNQLLVHGTSDAYSIELAKTSMNPKDAVIFLDGYLW
jgi:hypothetical protein